MLISGSKIKKYREKAKRIGLWDKNYASIKRDIPRALDDIREMDFSLDIVGAVFYQMVLVARMAVYGDSESDVSFEDMQILCSKMEELESLFLTPCIVSDDGEIKNIAEDIFPLFFKRMGMSKDFDEFEREMRKIISESVSTSKVGLSYGISYMLCLIKYPNMEGNIKTLSDNLRRFLVGKSIVDELDQAIKAKNIPENLALDYEFPALFAAMVVDSNLHKNRVMTDFMRTMHWIAMQNDEMYNFITSREFRLLMNSVEKYHGY